jgi:ribosomal protein S18 acetylase RimI-like enzyme
VIPFIRSATPEDGPVLVAIERESFSNPSWDLGSFFKHSCVVADIDGSVAGFLVSHETAPAHDNNPPEREILNLAVALRFRGMGIATALLEHELKRPGAHFLEVRESNRVAQALYRKFGFVEISRRSGYYELPAEAAIVMRVKKC